MSKIKSFFHSVFEFVKKKRILSAVIALAVIGGGTYFSVNGNGVPETVTLSTRTLVRNVKIAGKVIPAEKVDLGFEIAGTASYVGKNVGETVFRGETLVRLDSSSISAELLGAEADLTSAQAEFTKLEGGASYESNIENAKRSLIQAINDAYSDASDAVYNKSDQFFINPRSSRPEIAGSTDGGEPGLMDTVRQGRVTAGLILADWGKLTLELKASSYSQPELDLSKKYLSQITTFISDTARLVNMFEATDFMSQTTIDGYKNDMSVAKNTLNTASQDLINAENNLTKLLSDVPVQAAKVESAQAKIQNLRSKLNKTTLTAPINGVMAKQDAKIGQSVLAGEILVSIISPDYLIETFIPEVLIANVKIGNSAVVTLDAYGSEKSFQADVIHIDPAETIRDGVSTYKVKLALNADDAQIRSGMTANVGIETFSKPDTATVPERSIVKENDESFVYVLEGERGNRKIKVTTGEKDSFGYIEIISGLSSEDRVLINPPD